MQGHFVLSVETELGVLWMHCRAISQDLLCSPVSESYKDRTAGADPGKAPGLTYTCLVTCLSLALGMHLSLSIKAKGSCKACH